MNILLCDLLLTDAFPDLWWGLVVIVTILGALGIVRPIIQSHIDSKSSILDKQFLHEKNMKDDAFNRELKWYFIKNADKPIEQELDKCKKELQELMKLEQELKEGTKSLKESKEQFEKEILQTKIKAYEEIIKTIK